ncbi:MAG: hypothetical protein ISR72_04770 [Methylobacter sp.]|nr:hypothetical protein [Methylobacter sp.]
MFNNYRTQLALPPEVAFMVTWDDDVEIIPTSVKFFVNTLPRPEWYKHDSNMKKDTRGFLLELHMKNDLTKEIDDPFTGKTVVMWQCANCGYGVTYGGIDLGHKEDWRTHLIKAGVKTKPEAKAAYNNLNNLQIECATCNRSHDFEEINF